VTAKIATGNGNLQPEIESNEYMSSKKITRVVYYSSITGVLEYSRQPYLRANEQLVHTDTQWLSQDNACRSN